ncbi:crossover junction endodeoxyribonuclease RuvC [Candidatus Peregrinibacteria bacterium CG10_big_fil_rev_8_21_14_0_10_42_8]|nr:MAG: crossover junction endodeoxyribonuclease RuvC [Candidatus Peregrinibacteria bacterium CG10_big_fil_rev_8_21_14_0_10_42_8]
MLKVYIRLQYNLFAIRYTIDMKIIGIDPGLATIGIGLIESGSSQSITPIEWLTIETKAGLPMADRLREIADDLTEYLKENQPELAVIEKLYFSVNEKTALDVAQARGVILATVAATGIPIIEPTPPQLKSCITGDGQADKKQMQEMVKIIMNLEEIPQPDDAADALALAAFGAYQGKNATVLT